MKAKELVFDILHFNIRLPIRFSLKIRNHEILAFFTLFKIETNKIGVENLFFWMTMVNFLIISQFLP